MTSKKNPETLAQTLHEQALNTANYGIVDFRQNTKFENVLFQLYSTNKFKFQPLKCAKGGEACRCKFEEGCPLCKKLLLLDVWIDLLCKFVVIIDCENNQFLNKRIITM